MNLSLICILGLLVTMKALSTKSTGSEKMTSISSTTAESAGETTSTTQETTTRSTTTEVVEETTSTSSDTATSSITAESGEKTSTNTEKATSATTAESRKTTLTTLEAAIKSTTAHSGETTSTTPGTATSSITTEFVDTTLSNADTVPRSTFAEKTTSTTPDTATSSATAESGKTSSSSPSETKLFLSTEGSVDTTSSPLSETTKTLTSAGYVETTSYTPSKTAATSLTGSRVTKSTSKRTTTVTSISEETAGPEKTNTVTSGTTPNKNGETTTFFQYPGVTKPLGSLRIMIPSQIILSNATYDVSLNEVSSEIYKKFEHSLMIRLHDTYKDIAGFEYVIVNGFRNGSVVCGYSIALRADTNISIVNNEIINKTVALVNTSLTVADSIYEVFVNETSLIDSINTVLEQMKYICKLIDRPCEKVERCSPEENAIRCTHWCDIDKHVCDNGGVCIYDDRKAKTKCECTSDDDHTYYGPTCMIKAENLALLKSEIIGIGAGCGGGIVVILLVVIFVLSRRKPTKEKNNNPNTVLSREVCTDNIRLRRVYDSLSSNGFKDYPGKRAEPNPYKLRPTETKYLQGRAHNIYKDSNGEETYIYPPYSFTTSISGSRNRDSGDTVVASMYDYIDTESKFEIQRPRIHTSNYGGF